MLPHLAMLLAVTFWASSPTAIKFMLTEIPLFEAVSFRLALAALALWLVTVASRQLVAVRRVGWRPFAAGLIDPGVVAVITYFGIQLASAVHAIVIFALMPIVATLFGRVVLKEAVSRPVVGGAVLGIGGIVLLVADSAAAGANPLLGDALLLVAVLLICGAQLALRRVAQAHGSPLAATALQVSGAAVLSLLVMATLSTPTPLAWTATASDGVWIVFLYAAVVISAGSFFLYNFALRHLPVARTSLYTVLATPIGVPMAALILGERISRQELIGIALVVCGVALPALAAWRRRSAVAASG